jgi:hypothetical protein
MRLREVVLMMVRHAVNRLTRGMIRNTCGEPKMNPKCKPKVNSNCIVGSTQNAFWIHVLEDMPAGLSRVWSIGFRVQVSRCRVKSERV